MVNEPGIDHSTFNIQHSTFLVMTVTPITAARKSRDITVAYLGELLFNAGFIDDKQRADVDSVDRQHRAAQAPGSKTRADQDLSPFQATKAMHRVTARGIGT